MYFSKNGLLGRLVSETEDRVQYLATLEYIKNRGEKTIDVFEIAKGRDEFIDGLKKRVKTSKKDLSLITTYKGKTVAKYLFFIELIAAIVSTFIFIFIACNFKQEANGWNIPLFIFSIGLLVIESLVGKIKKELF